MQGSAEPDLARTRPRDRGREAPRRLGVGAPLQVFAATALEPCPYLGGQSERKVVSPLLGPEADARHSLLVRAGFRRSYGYAYRPACPGCAACVPVRVPVERFAPTRSLRRVARRNADLEIGEHRARAEPEHYALFARYVQARHGEGEMARMDEAAYRALVEETPVDTLLVEFRSRQGKLVAASLTDRVGDGLSGVYKFFDPAEARRSPGTFVILWHIARARALGLPYVYLGYWIQGSRKMAYKARFRPLEALRDGRWEALEHPPSAPRGASAEGLPAAVRDVPSDAPARRVN